MKLKEKWKQDPSVHVCFRSFVQIIVTQHLQKLMDAHVPPGDCKNARPHVCFPLSKAQ